MFPFRVIQKWTIALANLAKTTERVSIITITIPVPAGSISKDETVKVELTLLFISFYG